MSKMSVEEATYYWFLGMPAGDSLCASYPALKTDKARRRAWNDDNLALAREAMTVYMEAYPEELCVLTSFHPRPASASTIPGSLFSHSTSYSCYLPVYWDPPKIQTRHEGFTYTVTNPFHVAPLHEFRDSGLPPFSFKELRQQRRARPSYIAAAAYLFANYDSRVAWAPLVMTVPEGWHPGVWRLNVHPEEREALRSGAVHDPVRFPVISDVTAAAHAAGKFETTRYTIFGWRKLEEEYGMYWRAHQRYIMEHFDLKEVLDAEDRVLSSEWAADYQIETELPRL
ncbi:hypothetical protein B0H16DRAFT_1721434 [Mycena metata]|uniref:Uncharacterized protein n=1 Tax=Mycena metata TaxID=1033252 RepID=A0AAD7J8R3_9AGAR|nr:hypothetical protein B0H16DRAFT_1721434 [Mycena metata]